MNSLTDWLTLAAMILVPMTIGFFAMYNKLASIQSDVRSLRERDDDHGKRLDDHEFRLRRMEAGHTGPMHFNKE